MIRQLFNDALHSDNFRIVFENETFYVKPTFFQDCTLLHNVPAEYNGFDVTEYDITSETLQVFLQWYYEFPAPIFTETNIYYYWNIALLFGSTRLLTLCTSLIKENYSSLISLIEDVSVANNKDTFLSVMQSISEINTLHPNSLFTYINQDFLPLVEPYINTENQALWIFECMFSHIEEYHLESLKTQMWSLPFKQLSLTNLFYICKRFTEFSNLVDVTLEVLEHYLGRVSNVDCWKGVDSNGLLGIITSTSESHSLVKFLFNFDSLDSVILLFPPHFQTIFNIPNIHKHHFYLFQCLVHSFTEDPTRWTSEDVEFVLDKLNVGDDSQHLWKEQLIYLEEYHQLKEVVQNFMESKLKIFNENTTERTIRKVQKAKNLKQRTDHYRGYQLDPKEDIPKIASQRLMKRRAYHRPILQHVKKLRR
ncbi:hypothetical protein P9112_004460 [Eukaryota sp. TZLM1-RC]